MSCLPIAAAILTVTSAKVNASGPVMGKDSPSYWRVVKAAVATGCDIFGVDESSPAFTR